MTHVKPNAARHVPASRWQHLRRRFWEEAYESHRRGHATREWSLWFTFSEICRLLALEAA